MYVSELGKIECDGETMNGTTYDQQVWLGSSFAGLRFFRLFFLFRVLPVGMTCISRSTLPCFVLVFCSTVDRGSGGAVIPFVYIPFHAGLRRFVRVLRSALLRTKCCLFQAFSRKLCCLEGEILCRRSVRGSPTEESGFLSGGGFCRIFSRYQSLQRILQ